MQSLLTPRLLEFLTIVQSSAVYTVLSPENSTLLNLLWNSLADLVI